MINVTRTFLPPLEEYVVYLQQVWESHWLTNRGPLTLELESRLKDYLGVEHLLTVNNGTIALQIAIRALDLKGEIITTPFSYVATTSSIVWENCTPVFVDIDPDFLTLDETKIEAAITPNTQAILATHVYGNPCAVEAIDEIARTHGLKVIYDAAHCFGVKYRGQSLLRWGDIATLSFHATKLFQMAEGGGIVCQSAALAEKVRQLHNFGHGHQDTFVGLGTNGKLSELHAALGLTLLPYLPEVLAQRRARSHQYDHLLQATPLTRPLLREETEYNFAYYPVVFPGERDLLAAVARLNQQQVFPRRYFYPSLNVLPYVAYQGCPVSEEMSARVLCLPLFAGLTEKEVSEICRTIQEGF